LAFLDLLANKRGGKIIDKRDATDAVRVASEAGVQPHIGRIKPVLRDAKKEESLDELIDDDQKLSILPPISQDLFKVRNR
jgi:hypothetical protein